jgi:hypothetical protein
MVFLNNRAPLFADFHVTADLHVEMKMVPVGRVGRRAKDGVEGFAAIGVDTPQELRLPLR